MRNLSFSVGGRYAIGLLGLTAAGIWAGACAPVPDDLFGPNDTQSSAASAQGGSRGTSSGAGGGGGAGSGAGGSTDVCGGCPSELICDDMLGCVACVKRSDCPASAKDCVNGVCTGCGEASCPDGQTCQPSTGTCAPKCMNDKECGGNGGPGNSPTPVCDTARGVCVACRENSQCRGETSVCDKAQGVCVECLTSAECDDTTPVCDRQRGACVECVFNAQCPDAKVCSSGVCTKSCTNNVGCSEGVCDAPTGKCVECLKDKDCTDQGRSKCSPLKQCVECILPSDCGDRAVCINFTCLGG